MPERRLNVKTYSNRFAEMEKQSDGTWIVFNLVTGLPIYVEDGSKERKYNYQGARAAMVELYQHYSILERAW